MQKAVKTLTAAVQSGQFKSTRSQRRGEKAESESQKRL